MPAPHPLLDLRALRAPGHPARPLLAVLLLALLARLALFVVYDLSGFPGPGGALAVADPRSGISAFLLSRVGQASWLPLTYLARSLMVAGGMMSVLGAMLAAGRLGRWPAAVAAGVVVALWSQTLFAAGMIAPGNLAQGLAWLAVGLAFGASRMGAEGLLLIFTAGLLAVLGAAEYQGVLPSLAYLGMLPLLGPRDRRWRAVQLVALGLGVLLGLLLTRQHWVASEGSSLVALLWLPGLVEGLGLILHLGQLPIGYAALIPALTVGALVAAFVPGWSRPRDGWTLGLLTLLVLAITAQRLGVDGLRPRYLVPAMLGALVLLGLGLGNLAVLARRLGGLRWLPLVVVAAVLLVDGWAYGQRYAERRAEREGTALPLLPAPPAPLRSAYDGMEYDFSTSAIGAADLHALALGAPAAGVGGVRLRDGRESVLVVGALEAGIPYVILDQDRNCRGGGPDVLPPTPEPEPPRPFAGPGFGEQPTAPSDHQVQHGARPAPVDPGSWRGCAAKVIRACDEAGMRLILPVTDDGDRFRVIFTELGFVAALHDEAQATGRLQQPSPWWEVFDGRGSGPPPKER
jgi:hypothetical protein